VATLYEGAGFVGASTSFTASDPDLQNDPIGRGRASSIKIDCAGDGIYLYEHSDYDPQGWCRKFTANDADLSLLVFDDVASSIKFAGSYGGGKYVATLYEEPDYGGVASAFWADDPNFEDDEIKNGGASSIQIGRALPPAVTSITPNSGQNYGSVAITNLAGSGFQAGATVELTRSGQSTIQASNVSVASASKITCEFDLRGAVTGKWNVVVRNPDGQQGQLANGFTVTGFEGEERLYLPVVTR
jgi:hypothetical protein